MNHNYTILPIDKSKIDRLKPLWECQKKYHVLISRNFSEERQNVIFEDRKKEILEECKHIKIDLVISKKTDEEIGYCLSTIDHQQKGELDSLFIKEGFRKSGIGKKLVLMSIDWMEEFNVKRKSLFVIPENQGAIRFYESLGFKQRSIHLMS